MKRYLLPGLLLLALGAGLRFWALDRHSLWTDEFFTLQRISGASEPTEATPPLYFLLLKFWTGIAGLTPGAVRAFSATWGVAGLLVIWLAASRWIGRDAGLFALALAALSPFHLAYSQEARAYAMLFALSAASLWTLAESLRESDSAGNAQAVPHGGSRNRWAWWSAYLAVTAALLYTHYWGLFVWFAGALYAGHFAFRRSPFAVRRSLPVALAGVTFVPHLATLASVAAQHVQPDFWAPAFSPVNLGQAFIAFTGTRFYMGGWLFSLGLGVSVALGIWAALWTTGLLGEGNVRRWLVSCLAGGLLLPFLVSYALPQMFVPWRYTMAAFPAALWLAARGWSLWPAAGRALSATALLLLLTAGDWHYFTGYEKGNMKQAAELVANLDVARNGALGVLANPETVLIVPAYLQRQWKFYYHGSLPTIPEAGIEEMAPQLARYRHTVWVTLDVPNVVKEAMDARFHRVTQRRYPADFHLGLVVAVYRLR